MTSSNWLNYIVKLASSNIYLRLILLIYALALGVLLTSGLPLAMKLIITLLLCLGVVRFYRAPYFTSDLRMLVYKKSGWQLISHLDEVDCYDHFRVVMDIGLFLLIKFSTTQKCRLIIIFVDQISSSEHRFLKIIEKIK